MTIPWQTLTACYKPVQKQLKIKQTAKIQDIKKEEPLTAPLFLYP